MSHHDKQDAAVAASKTHKILFENDKDGNVISEVATERVSWGASRVAYYRKYKLNPFEGYRIGLKD